ncbi:MAG TPA: SDR family NAD(P)-dependent oxidoreductase [Longimicrobiaceae bacterium]|nr:SDR family NAD(P)-dependent oxidoreductase [Longimicrobiaceae bacterium]
MRERAYTLITGGAGFIGSNLADALLSDGERVVILDNLSRDGVKNNVQWLTAKHGSQVRLEVGDVTDAKRVDALVRNATRVFHLAAQVAVTTSLDDPAHDLQTNLIGTFNVLEAARAARTPPPVLFTSTNKVYGGLDHVPVERSDDSYRYADGRPGVSEREPLDFHSPYGCSKGAADQYVRDYARIFHVPTVVFRMSCIYGTRQFGTEDQGWVAHFARSLMGGAPITIYGDGCQVRDILWVDDLVRAMRAAMARIDCTAGEIFNLGGGARNAVSVRQVIDSLMEVTDRRVPMKTAPWRPGDQRIYISDTGKAEKVLGWRAAVSWREGLERLVDWLEEADLSTPVLPLRTPQPTAPRVAGAAI